MTDAERFALEAAAIAAFESFLRQQATEGRGRSVKEWTGLSRGERQAWRDQIAACALLDATETKSQ